MFGLEVEVAGCHALACVSLAPVLFAFDGRLSLRHPV